MISIGGPEYSRYVARDFIVTSFRFLTMSDRRSPPIYGNIFLVLAVLSFLGHGLRGRYFRE
jgi:hypothetical protein